MQIQATRVASCALRQRVRLVDPEEEANAKIAKQQAEIRAKAKERELAEATAAARSLGGGPPPTAAKPPTPEKLPEVAVPPPDLLFIVESRYESPEEAASKATKLAKEKLAEKREKHAELAARRKAARALEEKKAREEELRAAEERRERYRAMAESKGTTEGRARLETFCSTVVEKRLPS